MNRTGTVAEEYRKLRREERPAKARHAIQWARDRVAAYDLYTRAEERSRFKTSHCNDDGATVYLVESKSGKLRVELAFIPDYQGSEADDFGSDTLASLITYFRGPDERLGRHESYLRAVRAIKAREEAKNDTRDRYSYGISVRAFWNTPELEEGEPIGEASCWGFTDDGSQASDDYQWSSAVDQYREAMHGICGAIRDKQRQAFRAIMTEAFAANFAV